jgi:peptide chain release factor 1
MEKRILDKLDNLVKKHSELEIELSKPETVQDQAKFKELSIAFSDLTETVETYKSYKKIIADYDEAKKWAQSEDPELRKMGQEEITTLESEISEFEKRLKLLLLPKDPFDKRNVILEIRAGTGGEEAALFAGDVFRMYFRYAEKVGWRLEVLSDNPTGLGGYKEVIASISGEKVYSRLKYEGGVHRVQRVPETESSGRIHTSAITVAVLPEAEEIDIQIEEKDLRIDRFCSSGPGGQSVNTTYSAVRITHIPTNIVVSCQDEKSQIKNKAKALKILRSRLLQLEEEKRMNELSSTRKEMVKSGDRSEKIRTYNFPQNRVTDHRISLTLYRLSDVLNGDLDLLLEPLISAMEAQRMDEEFSKVVDG